MFSDICPSCMLKPSVEISFSAPVWRMEIDESTDTLCLEIRDAASKGVYFSTVGLNSAHQYVTNLTLPHGWQCGLNTAAYGVMLIHGYRSEILPVRKGLTAIDVKTGKILWENYNLNLENINNHAFEVYDARIHPKKLFTVDTLTGQTKIALSTHAMPFVVNIVYPERIEGKAVKELGLSVNAYGDTAFFLPLNNYRILSLHALIEGVVAQYLYVYDAAGNIVFEDIIARDIQKLQPEAFIVYKNKLIWLQNTSVLKILPL